MPVNIAAYKKIRSELDAGKVRLVAVSKTKPAEEIQELYNVGQKDFGENYVQELGDKEVQLPKDIRWHFIGHLQSNKVKYIAPFVHLIHGVDSVTLLREINKQALKNNRIIDCLLQIHIATEETKFGFNEQELESVVTQIKTNEEAFKNINLAGLMGMASFSDDTELIRKEFSGLKRLYSKFKIHPAQGGAKFKILSMGMSSDYKIAIEEGSNMVRIGSLLFGERNYPQ